MSSCDEYEQTIENETTDEYPSWDIVPYAVQEIMRTRCSVATVEKCSDDNMFLYCDYDYAHYLEMPKWMLHMAVSLLAIAQMEGKKFDSLEDCSVAENEKRIEIITTYSEHIDMPLIDCFSKLETISKLT